jgi:hypothetical protein
MLQILQKKVMDEERRVRDNALKSRKNLPKYDS